MITGDQLRERRVFVGYRSQRALAEALGESPRTIWEWENVSGVPTARELAVRRLLWPAPLELKHFDHWELLAEIGRRIDALSNGRDTGERTDAQGAGDLPINGDEPGDPPAWEATDLR